MPIVSALWAQKVKRWSDFLTFSASSTVFHHNNDAVVKLLQSCFSAALGLSTNSILENGGVGSFLGHGFGLHYSGGLSPVAPGILYLQIHRDVRDIILLTDQILHVLMFSVRKLASDGLPEEMREKLKKSKYGLKYGHISLLSGLSQLKVAASLASTLIWLSGGSSLINCLFREILPTLFLSGRASYQEGKECVTSMLEGYTLANFAVICGMFAWGVEPTPISKRRSKVIGAHLEFLAGALDGKITLGCSWGTWHAYVAGFLSLIVECAPCWIMEVELSLLKRLSNGLRLCNETDLAILLLGRGGALAMGAAAELIVHSQ